VNFLNYVAAQEELCDYLSGAGGRDPDAGRVAREYVAFVLHRAATVFIYFFAGGVARENVAFVLHLAPTSFHTRMYMYTHTVHTHTHTQVPQVGKRSERGDSVVARAPRTDRGRACAPGLISSGKPKP